MYHTKILEVSKDYALYTFAILFLCLKQAPLKLVKFFLIPAGIYLLKVKNKNNKVWNMFKFNDKDAKTSVFIANFEHISHLTLVFL